VSADYRATINGAEWKGFSHGNKGVALSGPNTNGVWLTAELMAVIMRIWSQHKGPTFVADVVEMCTCITLAGCSEVDSECPVCGRRDAYDPCPLMGFGCGSQAGLITGTDPCECCTPMQWVLAKEFWK
jgi:hypothetical protein